MCLFFLQTKTKKVFDEADTFINNSKQLQEKRERVIDRLRSYNATLRAKLNLLKAELDVKELVLPIKEESPSQNLMEIEESTSSAIGPESEDFFSISDVEVLTPEPAERTSGDSGISLGMNTKTKKVFDEAASPSLTTPMNLLKAELKVKEVEDSSDLLKAELNVNELVLPIEEESLSQNTKTKKVFDEAVTFINNSKQLQEKPERMKTKKVFDETVTFIDNSKQLQEKRERVEALAPEPAERPSGDSSISLGINTKTKKVFDEAVTFINNSKQLQEKPERTKTKKVFDEAVTFIDNSKQLHEKRDSEIDLLRSYNATLRAKLNLLKAELNVKELVMPIEEESLSQNTKTKKVFDEAVTFIDNSKQLQEKRERVIDLLRSRYASYRAKLKFLKAELNVKELVLPIEDDSLSHDVIEVTVSAEAPAEGAAAPEDVKALAPEPAERPSGDSSISLDINVEALAPEPAERPSGDSSISLGINTKTKKVFDEQLHEKRELEIDLLRSYNATLRAKLNLLKAELNDKELVLPIEEESLSQNTKTKKVFDEAVTFIDNSKQLQEKRERTKTKKVFDEADTFIDNSKQLQEKRESEIDLLRSYNATLRILVNLLKAVLNVKELVLPIEEESLSQNVLEVTVSAEAPAEGAPAPDDVEALAPEPAERPSGDSSISLGINTKTKKVFDEGVTFINNSKQLQEKRE
ncbi:calponin homology domain-containing protein DDB_G0272472-like [Ostrinia furnacalis]|uniref:calponin homology domain-containing protein DDB_G0272472-like n=1 Tax=Ostrinia furnacalis TaxID=93504 RepID=UPI00103F707B|nr:calponin homology domain-containing protein DDB_G0272472-like [Ostrinia furnacalis]